MIEYAQRRFRTDASLTEENKVMREYGWVYYDSTIDTNGAVVRYVRDTEMPHYQELSNAYSEYVDIIRQKEELKVPILRRGKKNACMVFVVLFGVSVFVALVGVLIALIEGGGDAFYLAFGFIGLPLFIVFLINLINVKKRYNLAMVTYRTRNKYLKDKLIQCTYTVAPYVGDEKINAFLETLEKRVRKSKEI